MAKSDKKKKGPPGHGQGKSESTLLTCIFSFFNCGDSTPDALLTHDRFKGDHIHPPCHLSGLQKIN
jgi:hypothetical protein